MKKLILIGLILFLLPLALADKKAEFNVDGKIFSIEADKEVYRCLDNCAGTFCINNTAFIGTKEIKYSISKTLNKEILMKEKNEIKNLKGNETICYPFSIPFDRKKGNFEFNIDVLIDANKFSLDPSAISGCSENDTHIVCNGTLSGNYIDTTKYIYIVNATVSGTSLIRLNTTTTLDVLNSTLNGNGGDNQEGVIYIKAKDWITNNVTYNANGGAGVGAGCAGGGSATTTFIVNNITSSGTNTFLNTGGNGQGCDGACGSGGSATLWLYGNITLNNKMVFTIVAGNTVCGGAGTSSGNANCEIDGNVTNLILNNITLKCIGGAGTSGREGGGSSSFLLNANNIISDNRTHIITLSGGGSGNQPCGNSYFISYFSTGDIKQTTLNTTTGGNGGSATGCNAIMDIKLDKLMFNNGTYFHNQPSASVGTCISNITFRMSKEMDFYKNITFNYYKPNACTASFVRDIYINQTKARIGLLGNSTVYNGTPWFVLYGGFAIIGRTNLGDNSFFGMYFNNTQINISGLNYTHKNVTYGEDYAINISLRGNNTNDDSISGTWLSHLWTLNLTTISGFQNICTVTNNLCNYPVDFKTNYNEMVNISSINFKTANLPSNITIKINGTAIYTDSFRFTGIGANKTKSWYLNVTPMQTLLNNGMTTQNLNISSATYGTLNVSIANIRTTYEGITTANYTFIVPNQTNRYLWFWAIYNNSYWGFNPTFSFNATVS